MPQHINHHAAPVIRIGSSVLFIASIAAVMGSLPVPQTTTVATAVPVDKTSERTMIGFEPVCMAEMPGVPMSLCFMPGTSAEEVNQVTQRLVSRWARDLAERPLAGEGDGGTAYFSTTRWVLTGSSVQGAPATLRWSMPADGLSIPDDLAGGAAAPNNLNATFVTKFGSLEAGKSLLRQVYARWSELSGVNYTEVTDDNAAWGASGGSTRGDIRVVGWANVIKAQSVTMFMSKNIAEIPLIVGRRPSVAVGGDDHHVAIVWEEVVRQDAAGICVCTTHNSNVPARSTTRCAPHCIVIGDLGVVDAREFRPARIDLSKQILARLNRSKLGDERGIQVVRRSGTAENVVRN